VLGIGCEEGTDLASTRQPLAATQSASACQTAGLPSHQVRSCLNQEIGQLKQKNGTTPFLSWPAADRTKLTALAQQRWQHRAKLVGSKPDVSSKLASLPALPTAAAVSQYLAEKAKLSNPCSPAARAYLQSLKAKLIP